MQEISERYSFDPYDYDVRGLRKSDGKSLRDVIKGFEYDFHQLHTAEYAELLYANTATMSLLARSNNAAQFLSYGMDLTHGDSFEPEHDAFANHEMDRHSKSVFVYGIDSAFMKDRYANGYPIIDENTEIYPLTLLVDDSMRDGTIRLAVPTSDDGDEEDVVNVDVPKFEYA